MTWLAVALGGALGASARFGVGQWLAPRAEGGFPWGTFLVNVLGCLAIGALLALAEKGRFSVETRAFLVTGLLGSFTTFSTFGAESFRFLDSGRFGLAAVYLTSSLLLGLAAVWIGRSLV